VTCRADDLGARRAEPGSAAVLAVVLVGVLVTAALLVAALGGVVADQRRVESAADLGALAGATAVQDAHDGCAAARSVVRRNGGRLTGCALQGPVVTVHTSRRTGPVLGRHFVVTSTARAGPAAAGGDGTAVLDR
jgi:secretion/DNA translocation related TadE-like protein